MSVNGSETLFCGTVVAFLADTLAAHDIGGFKIGVSFALRKCRVCMATQDSIQVVYSNPCTNRHLLAAEEQRMAERSAICNAHGQRLHANNGRAFE